MSLLCLIGWHAPRAKHSYRFHASDPRLVDEVLVVVACIHCRKQFKRSRLKWDGEDFQEVKP